MKQKIFVFLLSFFVAFPAVTLSQTVSAQALSLTDLSPFGIAAMSVHRGKNAVCDGIISPEEYGNGITQKNESGLYSLNREQTELGVVPSDFWQESYVSLCGDFVYCAIRLVSGNLPLNPIATEVGACYCITFSLGMSPGEHPALRSSVFSNTYYISSTDFSCVGFTGKRIARSIREISISSKPLSTFVESYVNNGIVTPDGNKWNATHYCENIAFSLESSGSTSTMIAEARFPLEDVLLSVHPSDRDGIRSAVFDPSRTLCGGFSSCVALDRDTWLVAGLPSAAEIPFSSDGETLSAWMASNFETSVSGVFIPKILPIPLYWSGSAPPIRTTPATTSKPVTETTASVSTTTAPPSKTTSSPQQLFPPSSDDPLVQEDESIFESLPDSDRLLPKNTEIIYDSSESTTTSDKKKASESSFASSILATVTGALLFACVLTLCIYFRDSDKKTSEEKNSKRKSNKKKQTKNK